MLNDKKILTSSFRDPAGFLFEVNGEIYRHIHPAYFNHYDHLMESGLYAALQQRRWLIPHDQSENRDHHPGIVIKPERVPFISYPYEWCFSQLKAAALLTLNIQRLALDFGMSLKDASCYNVQFHQGKAIFIDTLSFEKYQEGQPWQAYRQFCQHFLAPLMLMCYRDVRLNQLLKIYIDGIPLDLTSNLLPTFTKIKMASMLHIHLHAKLQKKYQQATAIETKNKKLSLQSLKHLIDSMINTINQLSWKVQKDSEWYDYYTANNNYSDESLNEKEQVIQRWVENLKPAMLWDLGANTGRFSSLVAKHCQQIVAFDIDTSCVESFYLYPQKSPKILPLVLDLTNPSPGLGWEHQERHSLMDRGPVDTILALGLIHHLAIVNNVPLSKIAKFFSNLTTHLIIEFIPKEDSQVQKLLTTREDIFPHYTTTDFQQEFSPYFEIMDSYPIPKSQRILYSLKNKRERS